MLGTIRNWIANLLMPRTVVDWQRSQAGYYAAQIAADHIRSAQVHERNGNREAALKAWSEARDANPDAVMRSLPALNLLVRLRAFDEAEAAMSEGWRRWPREPFFVWGMARIATDRADHEEAARHYKNLRKWFPTYREGHIDGSRFLASLGRLEEADRVLAPVAQNGDDLAVEHARLATRRKDWPTAIKRWDRLYNTYNNSDAPAGLAECLRETNRIEEAEQVILRALAQPSGNALACRTEFAMIAEARSDWAEASRRWRDVRLSSPGMIDAYRRGATALRKCGKDADADELLEEARARFPNRVVPEAAKG